jgi:hypothetical protein
MRLLLNGKVFSSLRTARGIREFPNPSIRESLWAICAQRPEKDNIMRCQSYKYRIFREMYFVAITLGLAAPIARFTS